MRMMKTLWPLCVAALALSLNGCGGGSSTTPAPTAKTPIVGTDDGMPVAVAELTDLADANNAAAAIRAHLAAGPTSGGADPFDTDSDPYAIAIRRAADSGPTVTLTPVPDTKEFERGEMFGIEGDHGMGWYGQDFEYEDEMAMTTEYVVVYTDIDEPTDAVYSEYFTSATVGDRTAVSGVNVADRELTLATQDAAMAARMGLFGSGVFPTVPGTFMEYDEDDQDTTDVMENKYPGTFYGVPGSYFCGNADCRAEVSGTGVLTLEGNWTFVPDGTDTAMISVPGGTQDDDYLWFGYWVETVDPDEGAETYTVQTFTGGSMLYEFPSDAQMVKGRATYTGAAGGVYMRRESLDTATTGTFTAKATVNAVFGGGDIGIDDQFKVSGMVEDFVDDVGRNLGWTAMLSEATIERSEAGEFTGVTMGDSAADAGAWSGQFYGPADDGADTPVPVLPTGVAGEFNANFNNGHAAGGFGATR